MEILTLHEMHLCKLTELTGFKNNGDVELEKSGVCIDDNNTIVAAIVVGNITNVPTLGKAIPDSVTDKNGSAQVLLLYVHDHRYYGSLQSLRAFLGYLLPSKILWCPCSEYTPEELLSELCFQNYVNGLTKTYFMRID